MLHFVFTCIIYYNLCDLNLLSVTNMQKTKKQKKNRLNVFHGTVCVYIWYGHLGLVDEALQ